MRGTPDNNPGGDYKSEFTEEQISRVLDELRRSPDLIGVLLLNAKSGNQSDLRFIAESGNRGISLAVENGEGKIYQEQK